MSRDRSTGNSNKVSEDFKFFISSELPIQQVYNMLKLKNMNEKQIDSIVERIRETREKIRKVVRKFLNKVNASYGFSTQDVGNLMRKGFKHAEKYGLNDVEKKVFINQVMKGDVNNLYSYESELKYGKMSKFFGFDTTQGQMIRLEAKDHSKLNELHMLYDATRHIHADVKSQLFNYRDCA
jgi:hypothetical protein